VVLRPQALTATVDSLLATFRVTVADITGEFDGEEETGSVDLEERNGAARAVITQADLLLVCGTASLKGLRSVVDLCAEAVRHQVEPQRLLPVVNRAPRNPRARAEITAALRELGGPSTMAAPLFVPERRGLEAIHRESAMLPAALVTAISRSVTRALGSFGAPPMDGSEPVAVRPGELGEALAGERAS